MSRFSDRALITLFVACVACVGAYADDGASSASVTYNDDIRPLLSDRCWACHGPDEAERAAGLRLDTQEGSRGDLGGYAAVVPGDPEASEIMFRLTADDEAMRMPPPGKGEPLSDDEIATIRRWIEQGARYARHWSYQPLSRPEVPRVGRPDWANNPIDRFVLSRLEAADLEPAPEADRLALARRVSLDLTGLPPTWDEAKALADDERPGAYERYVDRLLASPTFGERWARVWLDLARYADSAGYADDPPRTIWAYRDYVIRALNAGKPFDRFTIEQIAGDLLRDPGDDELIATAFHRNTLTNNEGGTNDEEFRNVAVVDRVNTTMSVWMGTTMACAQCHTHKYDPITQEEYFRFFAFFNNTRDSDKRDERPVLDVWTSAQKSRTAELRRRIDELKQTLAGETPELAADRREWIRSLGADPDWKPQVPVAAKAAERTLKIGDRGVVSAEGADPERDRYTLTIETGGAPWTAIRVVVPADQQRNFVISRINARWSAAGQLQFSLATADHEQPGFPASSLLRGGGDGKVDPETGWAIGGELGQPHRLTLVFSEPLPAEPGTLELEIVQESKYGHHLLDHFAVQATSSPRAADWAPIPEAVRGLVRRDPGELGDEARSRLADYYRDVAPRLAEPRRELRRAEEELAAMRPVTTVPVLRELPPEQRRETRVQVRGNYAVTEQKVSPGTPEVFPPLEQHADRDRLTLARWLVRDDNPLTPRVIANRHWEKLFGTGIVGTSEDFGAQGEAPSHPKLLDWLAVELRDGGWDTKSLIKQIVMSATYRQSSRIEPAKLRADPANRLLSRGPRVRISAEMVRDQALFVSGLLSDRMFGPPVRPPQPSLGLKAAFGSGTDWKTSGGENRYRRGVYTMWRRSSPYPSMATFDAPDRQVCTVRRDRTNTPLQALVTLNDPVYVEAAQALARDLIRQASSDGGRILEAFRRTLLREPTPAERDRLRELTRQTREAFRDQPDRAVKMATDPLGPLPSGADPAEYAAWTVVANVVLNLDEMFMKR